MLEVSKLSVVYGQHRALDSAALSVERGEIVVILGANGAGKTSLLKAIAGVIPALPGRRIRLGDRDLSGLRAHELVEAGLALVPEGRGIFSDLTVAENLLLGANPKRARRGEAAARPIAGIVSAIARAAPPERADHERRRAADGGDRPRADVESGHPAARRAFARPVTATGA
jgi:ABC-type branched-subunit amino acid transport system ATPase component